LKRADMAVDRAFQQPTARCRSDYHDPSVSGEAFTLSGAGSRMTSLVEQNYQVRMDAMSPQERMSRRYPC
jgi:hypothetical protein